MAKKINPKKYNLQTPIVAAYIAFLSTPREIRPLNEKTAGDFMRNHSIAATNSLAHYAKIKGFQEKVLEEQLKYKSYWIQQVNKGLMKRIKGMKIKEQGLTKDGDVRDLEKELPPDVPAMALLLKAYGDLVEKQEMKITGVSVVDISKELINGKK